MDFYIRILYYDFILENKIYTIDNCDKLNSITYFMISSDNGYIFIPP